MLQQTPHVAKVGCHMRYPKTAVQNATKETVRGSLMRSRPRSSIQAISKGALQW